MVAYLDAAQDRLADGADARFTEAVEAVRVGTIFAHDATQYGKWRRRPGNRPKGDGLTGAALESAVMNLARLFPENVTRGTI